MSDLRERIVEAYTRLNNKTEVARELGIDPTTVRRNLKKAGVSEPMATGKIGYIKPTVMDLPEEGEVKRYIITAAQNNTKLHTKLWNNLLAYAEYVDAQLMVARFTYNKSSYSSGKSVKPGFQPTADDKDEAWWDHRIDPYIADDPIAHGDCRWELAPGLHFAAEMNILPTVKQPFTSLESYTGRKSSIFPHSKQNMQSVASGKDEATKFMYTTGCITQRNYIKKKAGLTAEEHHTYGALIVEVTHEGYFFVRQLEANDAGAFYDVVDMGHSGATFVSNGKVTTDHRVEAVNWADVHASEMGDEIKYSCWGPGGIIDHLKPKFQFLHDVQSFRSRSHHEMSKFGKMYEKFVQGIECVEDEVDKTAEFVTFVRRDFCKTVVVDSNHDRHMDRWLDEVDFRRDPLNAKFYLTAQLARVSAIEAGEVWNSNKWSLQRSGVPSDTVFNPHDSSFVICRRYGGGIECGMHGDEGPDGARGSTMNLTKMGRKVNKGHDHKATIMNNVFSAGSCVLDFGFMTGPSSHSVSHIVTFPNATRQMITYWQGAWRA